MAPAAFLTPLQVTRSFGDDVWRLSATEIAFSIGMMVGGGIIASWGGFQNKIKTYGFRKCDHGSLYICTWYRSALLDLFSFHGFIRSCHANI